jgi:hypothetical protein
MHPCNTCIVYVMHCPLFVTTHLCIDRSCSSVTIANLSLCCYLEVRAACAQRELLQYYYAACYDCTLCNHCRRSSSSSGVPTCESTSSSSTSQLLRAVPCRDSSTVSKQRPCSMQTAGTCVTIIYCHNNSYCRYCMLLLALGTVLLLLLQLVCISAVMRGHYNDCCCYCNCDLSYQ